MDGWRLQRQGKRWFLEIIIAHILEILLLRIIDYLRIIFPEIQVDKSCMRTSKIRYMHGGTSYLGEAPTNGTECWG